jgi:hypothetical protein
MRKIQMPQTSRPFPDNREGSQPFWIWSFGHWDLFRISDFGFRIYRLFCGLDNYEEK